MKRIYYSQHETWNHAAPEQFYSVTYYLQDSRMDL